MKHILAIFLSFALVSTAMIAQPDLPSEEVDVLKTFEATLGQSTKLRTSPILPLLDTSRSRLSYNVPTRLLSLEYDPPRIRPLAIRKAKAQPVYNLYGKFGYGTPNMPYLDLHYNNGRNKKYAFGAEAHHHSASTNDRENQRFSNTGGSLNATYFLDAISVGGKIGYNQATNHFYGYDNQDTTFAEDDVKQKFSTFDLGVELFNSKLTQGDINYKVGFDMYTHSDNFNISETGFDIALDATKWFSEKHPLNLRIGNDYTSYDGDTTDNTNNLLYIVPSFTYHADKFSAKIGTFMGQDTDGFHVLPDVQLGYNIVGDKLTLIAGYTGDITKNSFRSISTYNPNIISQQRSLNTRRQHGYGGIKGQFSTIEYEVKLGNIDYKNLALYLNDTTDFKRFNVVYDDANSFNIQGTLRLKVIKNLVIAGTVDVNTFSTDSLAAAYHLPNLELNVSAAYKMLDDKLTITAELYNAGGITYLDENRAEQNTGGLFDLNFGAAYQVTDNIGAFINLNNVTNQKFERWYRYPNYGFNMLVGATVKF